MNSQLFKDIVQDNSKIFQFIYFCCSNFLVTKICWMNNSSIVGLFFASFLASSAGIGGGSINVAILLYFGGYDYSSAVRLSVCVLLGNLLLQILINVRRNHPIVPHRPLIYWECVSVLFPAEILGSNIGVILLRAFPESILLILAIATLVYAIFITIGKGISAFKSESVPEIHDIGKKGSLDRLEGNGETKSLLSRKDDSNGKENEKRYPWILFYVTLVVWSLYALLYLVLRRLQICSLSYGIVFFAIFPLLIGQSYWCLQHIIQLQRQDSSLKVSGDLDFTQLSYGPALFSFFIGIACSLLGIGGGELFGPLLLSYKLLPEVSSATTSMFSFLVTSSSLVYYISMDEFPFPSGLWGFGIGALGGLLGRGVALLLVSRFHRPSILIFTLVGVLIVSMGMNFMSLFATSWDLSLSSFC